MNSFTKKVALIGAVSSNGVYGVGRGRDGGLAWKSHADMDFFKQVTTGGTVIMTRGTWLSLHKKVRPLPDRVNVIVTNNLNFTLDTADIEKGVSVVNSVEQAIIEAETEKVFVIGGPEIWEKAMSFVDILLISVICLNIETEPFSHTGQEIIYFPQLLQPEEPWSAFTLTWTGVVMDFQEGRDSFGVEFRFYFRKVED